MHAFIKNNSWNDWLRLAGNGCAAQWLFHVWLAEIDWNSIQSICCRHRARHCRIARYIKFKWWLRLAGNGCAAQQLNKASKQWRQPPRRALATICFSCLIQFFILAAGALPFIQLIEFISLIQCWNEFQFIFYVRECSIHHHNEWMPFAGRWR